MALDVCDICDIPQGPGSGTQLFVARSISASASVQYSMQSQLFHKGNLAIAQDLLTSKMASFVLCWQCITKSFLRIFLKKSYEAIHHWQHCSACPFLLNYFLQGLGTPIAILQLVFRNCISN